MVELIPGPAIGIVDRFFIPCFKTRKWIGAVPRLSKSEKLLLNAEPDIELIYLMPKPPILVRRMAAANYCSVKCRPINSVKVLLICES